MMNLLAVLGVFASVLFVLLTVLIGGEERRETRASLKRLHGGPTDDVREMELLASLRERVLLPVVGGLAKFSDRFTPSGYVAATKQKLVLAGNPPGLDADRFLALKVLGAVSGPVWAFLILGVAGMGGFYGVIATGLMWGSCFAAPDAVVKRKIEERQHLIALRLPDMLDLLVISVEAGLGFEQALDRTSAAIPGPLADEFRRMLQETRVGSTRAEALRAMDERTQVPDLHSFILAMLQADTFGVSIGKILRTQSEEMRVRRRQRVQEKAQKAPVKMMFPLIFCIFPSLFVVILGPAAVQIVRTFSS